MKIMSHCDFEYFKYCEGLVKSIRHSGNNHHIILKLLDFTEKQKEYATQRLLDIKDIDLDFIVSREHDFWIPVETGKYSNRTFQLYTDCRPFLIYDVLKKYNENLLSICANGLVLTKLTDVENGLQATDFVFKERKTWFGLNKIEDIEKISIGRNLEASLLDCYTVNRHAHGPAPPESEYVRMMDYLQSHGGSLSLEQIVHLPITRVCLLGTLGISNNSVTKEVIKRWKGYILKERMLNKTFFTTYVKRRDNPDKVIKIRPQGDTLENDSFARAYINVGLDNRIGRKITKQTNLWDGNIVDPSCTSDKIWFAKGSIKKGGGIDGKGKRYLKKLKSFTEEE